MLTFDRRTSLAPPPYQQRNKYQSLVSSINYVVIVIVFNLQIEIIALSTMLISRDGFYSGFTRHDTSIGIYQVESFTLLIEGLMYLRKLYKQPPVLASTLDHPL